MHITVLYFAQAATLCEAKSERFELKTAAPRLLDAVQHVMDAHPSLKRLESSLQWAVDESIVGLESPLRDGATVAVMPPFSGG